MAAAITGTMAGGAAGAAAEAAGTTAVVAGTTAEAEAGTAAVAGAAAGTTAEDVRAGSIRITCVRSVTVIIERKIEGGEYPCDMRLPSESEFMEEYELGRSTVRRTMAWLRDQGLVETVPTRCTYVK